MPIKVNHNLQSSQHNRDAGMVGGVEYGDVYRGGMMQDTSGLSIGIDDGDSGGDEHRDSDGQYGTGRDSSNSTRRGRRGRRSTDRTKETTNTSNARTSRQSNLNNRRK